MLMQIAFLTKLSSVTPALQASNRVRAVSEQKRSRWASLVPMSAKTSTPAITSVLPAEYREKPGAVGTSSLHPVVIVAVAIVALLSHGVVFGEKSESNLRATRCGLSDTGISGLATRFALPEQAGSLLMAARFGSGCESSDVLSST